MNTIPDCDRDPIDPQAGIQLLCSIFDNSLTGLRLFTGCMAMSKLEPHAYLKLYHNKIKKTQAIKHDSYVESYNSIAVQVSLDEIIESVNGPEAVKIYRLLAYMNAKYKVSTDLLVAFTGLTKPTIELALRLLSNYNLLLIDADWWSFKHVIVIREENMTKLTGETEEEFIESVLSKLKDCSMSKEIANHAKHLWVYSCRYVDIIEKYSDPILEEIFVTLESGGSDLTSFGLQQLDTLTKHPYRVIPITRIFNRFHTLMKYSQADDFLRRFYYLSYANLTRGEKIQQENALHNFLAVSVSEDSNKNIDIIKDSTKLEAIGHYAFLNYKLGHESRKAAIYTLRRVVKRLEMNGLDSITVKEIYNVMRHHLGYLWIKDEFYDLASDVLEKVHSDRSQLFGEDHLFTLETKREIGICLFKQGYFKESLAIFTKVLTKHEAILGPDHSTTCCTRFYKSKSNCCVRTRRQSTSITPNLKRVKQSGES